MYSVPSISTSGVTCSFRPPCLIVSWSNKTDVRKPLPSARVTRNAPFSTSKKPNAYCTTYGYANELAGRGHPNVITVLQSSFVLFEFNPRRLRTFPSSSMVDIRTCVSSPFVARLLWRASFPHSVFAVHSPNNRSFPRPLNILADP